MDEKNIEIRVLLHNIRSSHNVGSMFRTGDAIGVTRMYLSGFTPSPVDKFLRPNKEIAKTALGAEHTIPWEHVETFTQTIESLKAEGFMILGLEQDVRAQDYRKSLNVAKVLFVVGSEVEGMSAELRAHCDVLVEIPMRGKKESLNVAVAFGVAVFCLFGGE